MFLRHMFLSFSISVFVFFFFFSLFFFVIIIVVFIISPLLLLVVVVLFFVCFRFSAGTLVTVRRPGDDVSLSHLKPLKQMWCDKVRS